MRRLRWTKDELERAVKKSICVTETLRCLKLGETGGNYLTIKKYIREWFIDTSHFLTRSEFLKNRPAVRVRPIAELLVKEPHSRSRHIKERLYKEGLKKRQCELCGQGEMWQGKWMSLILDHINGDKSDNRLLNLRIVCPNCEGTLPTHCGRNKSKIKNCKACGHQIRGQSLHCGECIKNGVHHNKGKPRPERRKVMRPRKDRLASLITRLPLTSLAKRYGVSDNAVRKWVFAYGLRLPEHRPWKKQGRIIRGSLKEDGGLWIPPVKVRVLPPELPTT